LQYSHGAPLTRLAKAPWLLRATAHQTPPPVAVQINAAANCCQTARACHCADHTPTWHSTCRRDNRLLAPQHFVYSAPLSQTNTAPPFSWRLPWPPNPNRHKKYELRRVPLNAIRFAPVPQLAHGLGRQT